MKAFLFFLLIISCTTYCSAQKYVLVDKKMNMPVTFANAITVEDNFKGYFVIEKSKIADFIAEVDKIAKLLSDPTLKKPEKMDFLIGATTFHGLKVPLSVEERMDIVISTDYGSAKSTMHLADANISNSTNAFFITTWLKYIRSYVH